MSSNPESDGATHGDSTIKEKADQDSRFFETDHTAPPEVIHNRNPSAEKIYDPSSNEKVFVGQKTNGSQDEKIYAAPGTRGNANDAPELAGAGGGLAAAGTICGLRRKTFLIALGVAIFVVLAAAIGGGVGGGISARNRRNRENSSSAPAASPSPTPHVKTSPIYENSGLAATQWKDELNITHYRVYFQNSSGIIQQSAWDSNSTDWDLSDITTPSVDAELGTPIASGAGYPHAMKNYTLVTNVYYMGVSGKLYERQAPGNDTRNLTAWADNNFSGLYTAANTSFLAAHWVQDFDNINQTLVVMWQQQEAVNGLTIGKYTSDVNNSNPWVFTNLNFSVPDGSPFAISGMGGDTHVQMYTSTLDDKIVQQEYDTYNNSIWGSTNTDSNVQPGSPLAAIRQDNTGLYSVSTRPECAWSFPYTQLVLYAPGDATTLELISWNCSSGFVNLTADIQPVLRENREYLGMASHEDSKFYVMFDQGDGPEIEEWQVPVQAGQPWNMTGVRNVTTRP